MIYCQPPQGRQDHPHILNCAARIHWLQASPQTLIINGRDRRPPPRKPKPKSIRTHLVTSGKRRKHSRWNDIICRSHFSGVLFSLRNSRDFLRRLIVPLFPWPSSNFHIFWNKGIALKRRLYLSLTSPLDFFFSFCEPYWWCHYTIGTPNSPAQGKGIPGFSQLVTAQNVQNSCEQEKGHKEGRKTFVFSLQLRLKPLLDWKEGSCSQTPSCSPVSLAML